MTDTDKIVAAIFAARMCGGNAEPEEYLQAYEEFLDLMKKREKAKHPPPDIGDAALEQAKHKPGRKL